MEAAILKDSDAQWRGKIQTATGCDVEAFDDGAPSLDIPSSQLLRVLAVLKSQKDIQCRILTDIVVIDRPWQDNRFELNYLLTSPLCQQRVIVRTFIEEGDPIRSISSLYASAALHEAETREQFGILFTNAPENNPVLFARGRDSAPKESSSFENSPAS